MGQQTQLERIEAKLDALLARLPEKKTPRTLPARVEEYTYEFEQFRSLYPKRTGANSKQKAFAQWKLRHKEGDIDAMFEGLERYKEYLEVEEVDPRYVMMTATFIGRDKHYKQEYKVNRAAKQKAMMPRRDEDLQAFAVKMNLHSPGCAPQHLRNSHEYRKWISERL